MEKYIELSDGFVTLRPYRPDDADALYEAVKESTAELSKYMPVWLSDYTPEECRAWIESQAGEESYTFATFDAANHDQAVLPTTEAVCTQIAAILVVHVSSQGSLTTVDKHLHQVLVDENTEVEILSRR